MTRRYNKSNSSREIHIRRIERKTFAVVENKETLFVSTNFDECVTFLKTELAPKEQTQVRRVQ